jgi:phenylpropionate dioxygenase-like ring-hydroxylating dioxygenase large terminal subunit
MAATIDANDADILRVLRKYWHPVAMGKTVEKEPVHVKLLDEGVVLYRDADGQVAALKDLCIHRGTPLSLGKVTPHGTIQCAYHGWEFDGTGRCTFIPAKGKSASIPGAARAEPFRAVEKYDLIWVALDEPETPLPDWPYGEWDKPGYRHVMLDAHFWKTSAGRTVDNFLDIAHLPFVHEGILAAEEEGLVPEYQVDHTPYGLYFSREESELDTPHSTAGENIFWEYFLYMPFTAHIKKTTDSGKETIITLLASPTSNKETTFFFGIGRNYELEPENDQKFVDFHYTVSAQDRRIIEQQRPEEIPTDLREELHIKIPDATSMAYRRLLAALGTPADQLP